MKPGLGWDFPNFAMINVENPNAPIPSLIPLKLKHLRIWTDYGLINDGLLILFVIMSTSVCNNGLHYLPVFVAITETPD